MADDSELNIVVTADISDAESNLSELDSMVTDYNVSVYTQLDGFDEVQTDLEDIPDEVDTNVNVEQDDNSKKVTDDIHFMATLKKIKIAVNIAKEGIDIAMDVVNPLLDVQDAAAKVRAQTGQGFPGLEGLINDIKAADLGTSYDEIANVMVAAQNIGAPMEDATRAALTFTHTFKDQDPVTVMTTLNTLATTFGVNMQAAADIMTVAFQQGLNKGGDLLGVVNSNSQSWKDMGLTSTQALTAINSLMKGGVDNATDAAKGIQTLDDALTAASANAKSPQAQALKMLGITNPKDQGKAMGADFMDGFAEHFANLPSDQQDIVSGALFGKIGKKFTGALTGLTTSGGPFADYIGAAQDAAQTIDDSLRGSINDFINEIQTEMVKLFSSDKIDLAGFLDKLKAGFQTATDVLAGGGTLGQALEKGFGIQGFDKTLTKIESVFGNVEITVLQIVQAIQKLQGIDTTGISKQIESLSKGQMQFDLEVSNPDELTGIIQTALSRGVSQTDAGQILLNSIQDTIDKGDFAQTLNLFKGIENAPDATPEQRQAIIGKFTGELQSALDSAIKGGEGDKALLIGQALGLDPATLTTVIENAKATLANFGNMATGTAAIPSDVQQALGVEGFNQFKDMTTGVGAASSDFQTSLAGMNEAGAETQTQLQALLDQANTTFAGVGTGAQTMDTTVSDALVSHSVVDSFQAVVDSAQSGFPIVIDLLSQTADEAQILDQYAQAASISLGGLAGAVKDFNLDKLQAIVTASTGLAGAQNIVNNNNSTQNVTVNQTNNNQNNAQSGQSGYQIATAIRGQ